MTPHDPVGRLLFNVLAMVAEVESDPIRLRTREGMRVAKAKGRLRGKHPSSTPVRKPTWRLCTGQVSTAPLSWQTCSASLAPPSTAPCNAIRLMAWPVVAQQREAWTCGPDVRCRRALG